MATATFARTMDNLHFSMNLIPQVAPTVFQTTMSKTNFKFCNNCHAAKILRTAVVHTFMYQTPQQTAQFMDILNCKCSPEKVTASHFKLHYPEPMCKDLLQNYSKTSFSLVVQ